MTLRKKLLAAAGLLLGCVLVALVLLPILFRGPLTERARTELDRAVAAHVDWSGMGLTFFRDFPNLTLSVRDLTVVGTPPFADDTVTSMASLRFVLDVGSVVRALRKGGPVVVRSIRLDEPTLRLRVLQDGTANWDVLNRAAGKEETRGPAAAGAGASSAVGRTSSVELHSFAVTGGTVDFENEQAGVAASLSGLEYQLAGNLSRDRVVVRNDAHADRATVSFAGIPWVSGARLDLEADLDADLVRKRLTFQENELRLNDLALRFSGDAAAEEDGIHLNVSFSAPGTEFAHILSLVPAVYAHDFASLETSGTFSMEGRVQGTYGEGALPAFTLHASVDDGMFRYPDLPLPARDISAAVAVENPGGDVDSTVVRVERFHVVIGDQPLDAALTLRTPVSDPDVDASLKGTLDLSAVPRTIKLEDVEELAGTVAADASVHARLSDVDSARYDRVSARGTLAARNVTLRGAGLTQPAAVDEATLALTPRRADLKSFQARIGASDVQATGWVDNILGFVLRDEPLHGSATFASRHFALDEWRSDDPTIQTIPVPPTLDLTLSGTVDTLTLGALRMTDARGSLGVRDQRLTLDDFTLRTLGGRMGFKGWYDTRDPSHPTFDLGLTMDSLDVSGAADAFQTVRALAPVARYARGTFSSSLALTGALNQNLTPVLAALDGKGSLLTSRIAVEGFPLMQRLSDALKIQRLASPTLDAVRSTLDIREGRLYVRPFRVGVGDFAMSVEGSNGIDQSMDYTLGLTLPRTALGGAADQVVQGLAARANRVGFDVRAADSVRVRVKVGGTVTAPTLDLGLGEATTSARKQVEGAAAGAVERRVENTREEVDSASVEARRRAREQADSIVAEAERRADAVRAEAKKLAYQVRAVGDKRADVLLAKATSPIARAAAQPAADRIRKEAEDRASRMEREADQRAEAIVTEARKKADELVGSAGGV